jgi:hypothetical protein
MCGICQTRSRSTLYIYQTVTEAEFFAVQATLDSCSVTVLLSDRLQRRLKRTIQNLILQRSNQAS